MEKQVIQEAAKNSPGIIFYPDVNMLELTGRSIPENPKMIFSSLDEWITLHFERNNGLDIHIKLEYINSGSSQYLYEILKRLTGYGLSGKVIKMKWFYEVDDESMKDLGEHYRDTAGIPLEVKLIVSKKER